MLKLLACLFMLIDHIGYYFEEFLPAPVYLMLRIIGRLAFPIFAWSVALGCHKTRNPLRYFLRMSVFAILTEVLIRFLNQLSGSRYYPTNVMITFALAIVLVFGYQMATRSGRDMIASLRPISPLGDSIHPKLHYHVRINLGGIELDSRFGLALGILMILVSIAATVWLEPDYSLYGLASVLIFFVVQERVKEGHQFKSSLQYFALMNLVYLAIQIVSYGPAYFLYGLIQCVSIGAVPIIYSLASSKRPGMVMKYFFYIFYPGHILILVLLYRLVAQV